MTHTPKTQYQPTEKSRELCDLCTQEERNTHVFHFHCFSKQCLSLRLLCLYSREKLEAKLKASQGEKHAVDSMLSSFEFFGKEFEVLAEEYSRLRQEIDTKNWALKEFSYPTN